MPRRAEGYAGTKVYVMEKDGPEAMRRKQEKEAKYNKLAKQLKDKNCPEPSMGQASDEEGAGTDGSSGSEEED